MVSAVVADVVVVEGAGGWRVPITDDLDMGGLAKAMRLPVLVVARAGLGTINHSVLTAEAVTRDGCLLAGLVLSRYPDDDDAFTESNRVEIERLVRCPTGVYDGRDEQLDAWLR